MLCLKVCSSLLLLRRSEGGKEGEGRSDKEKEREREVEWKGRKS